MKSYDIPTKYYILTPIQLTFGGATWFYLFGVGFNNGISYSSLFYPICIASAVAFISVALSSFFASASPLILSAVHSAPYWAWTYFAWSYRGNSDANWVWLGAAAATHLTGLLGGVIVPPLLSKSID